MGRPQHIIITRQSERSIPPRHRPLWKFTLLDEDENVLDYTFASTRGLVWGMAKRAWRRTDRTERES